MMLKTKLYSFLFTAGVFVTIVLACLGTGFFLSYPLFIFSEKFPGGFFIFSVLIFSVLALFVIVQLLKKQFSFKGLTTEEIIQKKINSLIKLIRIPLWILGICGFIFFVFHGKRLTGFIILVFMFILLKLVSLIQNMKRNSPANPPESTRK